MDPFLDSLEKSKKTIESRVHSGTVNIASHLTLKTALDYHLQIGPEAKQERLRYLRNQWVSFARSVQGVEVLTPDGMHGGITSFRIRGRTSSPENSAICQYFWESHNIFSVHRRQLAKGDCIRITPALFTSLEDISRFNVALEGAVKLFPPL